MLFGAKRSVVLRAIKPIAGLPALIAMGSLAQAACTPAATSAPLFPGAGTTVTCSGTTANQNGTSGYGTGAQAGITINVVTGATVTGSARGFSFDDATVNNSGSITGTSSRGIDAFSGVTVNNTTTGSIRSSYGIYSGGFANVTNSGSITGTTFAISASTNATVINTTTGSIAGGLFGISTVSDFLDLTNYGSVIGTSYGIYGYSVTAINYANGRIAGDNSYGVWSDNAANVTNHAGATITGGIYAISGNTSSGIFNAGTITGGSSGAIEFRGAGNTLTLAPGSVISGNVVGSGTDTFQLGGSGAASFDISQLGAAAQYQGFSIFNKIDSSVWTLTGTSSLTGPVNVNGGTLAVNGNLASVSLLTVNAGGTLGGSGTLGATAINGGTLAPGNSIGTLTMSSLTMTTASTYLVQVSGASSDKTSVTGTATIAGRVSVDPLTPLGATTTYVILNAGTLSGTFDSVSLTNNFARNARLSYVGNDVLLTLDASQLASFLPNTVPSTQRNVAAAIDEALRRGATVPVGFNALYALSGNDLQLAVAQISGETAAGAQQTSFDAMTMFMGAMTDTSSAGRSGDARGATGFAAENDALAFAPDGRKRSNAERDAYAMVTKAPPRIQEPRWSVWASGFGGASATNGNATLGSGRTTSTIGGGAVGADYWLSTATVAGFTLAGGGSNFSVAGGGSGHADLFQAGAFVRHTVASSYITAAAAYGWQDVTTERVVTLAGTERLRASFNTNSVSGRIEGGNRWLLPSFGGVGVTPYAALQITALDLPAYTETSVNNGGGFALAYAAKTVTVTRSELGLRSDMSFAVADALLTLRGRAAWAHDYNTDRNVQAAFQSLPGSSFVVNGAAAARNAALTTASAEMSFGTGLSLAATFEGEFSDVTRSYMGKGVVRQVW